MSNNFDYNALKTKITDRAEEYCTNEAKCGEDVQKANILKRVTLSGLNKMERKENPNAGPD